jgi:hypothetical protein
MNEDSEEIEEIDEVEDEDKIAKNPEFKEWISTCHANTSALKVLLKLTEFVDGNKDEVDDDDYEDEDEVAMED